MHSHSPPPFRQALPWLLAVAGVFFLNFTSRTLFSPLLPALEADLGLSHAQAGRILLLFSLGYSVALFFSGFVSCRLTHRDTLTLSTVGMGLCLAGAGQARDPLMFSGCLVLFGMLGGLYLPSGLATLTSLTRPMDYGKALSIHEMAPNLSFIVAPLLVELFLEATSWRHILTAVGLASVGAGLLFRMAGRGGEFRGAAPRLTTLRRIARRPVFWVLLVYFAMGVGASMGPYSMLPIFLVESHGYTRAQANELLSLSRLAGPLMTFAAGYLSDRLGSRRTLMWYLAAGGLSTAALGSLSGWTLVAAVVVQPLCSILFFPAGFACITRTFAPEDRGLAVAGIVPVAIVAGNGLLPALLGWLGDHQLFPLGFHVLGGLLLVGLALLRHVEEPAS